MTLTQITAERTIIITFEGPEWGAITDYSIAMGTSHLDTVRSLINTGIGHIEREVLHAPPDNRII